MPQYRLKNYPEAATLTIAEKMMMVEYTGPLFEELKELRFRRPFAPFAVKLKTGGRVEIRDSFGFAISRRLIVIMDPRVDLKWDEIEGFELLQSASRHAEIVGLLRREPFVPFSVIRKNGERYEVAERGRAGLSEFTIGIAPPNSRLKIFQMDEVVGVEIHEPTS